MISLLSLFIPDQSLLPVGVRLHNPGNIKLRDPWQGLTEKQRHERFCEFVSNVWGFRAMAQTLVTYQDRYGINTIAGIIARWAPPEDGNDVLKYINHVCVLTGYSADEKLNLHTYEDSWKIVRAITTHEQGSFDKYFQNWEVDEGLRRAGIEGVPQKPLIKTMSGVGTAIAAASTAAASDPTTVITLINQVKPVLDNSCIPMLHSVFTIATLIGIGLIVIGLVRKHERSA